MSSKMTTFWAAGESSLDIFIRALYLGDIVSPLATDTLGVDVGRISVHTGNADSCKQCNVAAESSSATGIMGGDTTEIADKEFLILSYVIPVPHRQVQLRVDPPCMWVKVALAT